MTIITHSFRRHPRWSSFGSKVSLALLVVVCVFWLRYLDAGGRYNEENRMLSNRTQVGGRIVNVIAPMASVVNMKERYNGSIDTSILAISTGVLELTDWEKERRKEKENLEAERKKKEDARYAQSQMEREKAAEYADKLDNRRSKAELQNAITTKAGEDMSTSSSIVNPSVETTAPPCANLPGSEDILLILKVGATEVYEKLTQHFLTTFLCSPNVIIWSDMSQTIGPYEIHDAISSHSYGVRQDLLSSHQDFESYRKYAEYFSKTQDLGKLKGASGWNLDKWKFLPMVLESYERFPDKKWYIVVEADTYISWTNYLLWTSKLPAEEMVYAGCQVMIGKTIFAHGGSSFLLSNPSLKSLKRIAPDLKAAWENRTSGDCCGDKILSEALQEGGVRPMSVWPMIQGETPTTLDWSERHWCSPALSWHHLSSAEVDALWKFEQEFVTKHVRRLVFQVHEQPFTADPVAHQNSVANVVSTGPRETYPLLRPLRTFCSTASCRPERRLG